MKQVEFAMMNVLQKKNFIKRMVQIIIAMKDVHLMLLIMKLMNQKMIIIFVKLMINVIMQLILKQNNVYKIMIVQQEEKKVYIMVKLFA